MRSIITVAAASPAIGLAVLSWRATRPLGVANHPGRQGIAGSGPTGGPVTRAHRGLPDCSRPTPRRGTTSSPRGCLPLVVPSVLDGILLARLTLIAAAYVPGRVIGMTPVSRRSPRGCGVVTPWLQLACGGRGVTLLLHTTPTVAEDRRGDDGPTVGHHPRLSAASALTATEYDERHRHGGADGRDSRAGVVDEEADRQRDDERRAGPQRRQGLKERCRARDPTSGARCG